MRWQLGCWSSFKEEVHEVSWEVLSTGLNSCTKTKQFIEAKMLLMFTGAVAVSPVFTSWPSLDPASMMGWFTALCTPTHLPFNLHNYLSPPLFLSLHFCPTPSSPTTSTFWYSFLQCQLEPLSLSINSLLTSADSPSLPVSFSRPLSLSAWPCHRQ